MTQDSYFQEILKVLSHQIRTESANLLQFQ
jgi:hypothetical protein